MRKLDHQHIKIHTPLDWDVCDEQGNLLLRKGFIIESENQIEGLIKRGLYADVRTASASAKSADTPVHFDPFWLWDDILSKLILVLRDVEAEEMVESRLLNIASMINTLTDKDADAALGAILLKDWQRYSYAHALQVAVLAVIVSKNLGWDEDARRDLLCAALSMNIAIVSLQIQLPNQNKPLSTEQKVIIAAHAQKGHDLLLHKGIRNPRWLQAVQLHHTKQVLSAEILANPDGSALAELLRFLDIFCAKITPRTYRPAILPPIAVRQMYADQSNFEAKLTAILIHVIGMYMPGTFVKLENGDVALVIRRGANINTPEAIALSRTNGMPYTEIVPRNTARHEFAVLRAVGREHILRLIDLPRLWGYTT